MTGINKLLKKPVDVTKATGPAGNLGQVRHAGTPGVHQLRLLNHPQQDSQDDPLLL